MKTAFRRTAPLVAASTLALALTLSGCSTASSGGGSTTAATPVDSSTFSADQIALGVEYTGGTAGAADTSLDPVKIGFINVDGGVPSFPESTNAAEVAVRFINEQLGGVDGHPVEIVQCNIVQGEEDAQKCAQDFANDPDILTVQLGMTVLGTGPIYTTLGESKNVVGQGTFNPNDLDQPGVNFYEAAAYATGPGVIVYANDYLKAKKIAVVYDGTDPGASSAAQVITGLGPQFDMDITSVPATNTSEWASALAAAGAQTADAVVMSGSTTACVPFAEALQQLGVTAPVETFGFCQDSSVAEALGDYPKWTYIQPLKSPIGVEDADVQLYNAVMDAYSPDANRAGGANGTFQMFVSQVRALNEVGYDNLSVEAIRDAVHDFTGPVFVGPQTIECGQYADQGAQSLCTTAAFPVNYEGDGTWTDPTDGVGLDVGDLALTAN